MRIASGSIILSKSTKRILLSKRSKYLPQAGKWTGWGGWLNNGEDPQHGALRELVEETRFSGQILIIHSLSVFERHNFRYHNFLLIVETEFEPFTDWETEEFAWFNIDEIPDNKHFGLNWLLETDGDKIINYINEL